MNTIPNTIPITKIKSDPGEVLTMIEQGPILITNRGSGAAVMTSLTEWNRIAEQLARLKRAQRYRAAMHRDDVVDFDDADSH